MPPDAAPGADAWLAEARARLEAATLGAQAEEVGRVEEVGDGIALVSGLPGLRLDELLHFGRGQTGFAQVLERNRIGCVLLDGVDEVEAGDAVHCTSDVVRVPVGPGLLAGWSIRSEGRSTARGRSPPSDWTPSSGRRPRS